MMRCVFQVSTAGFNTNSSRWRSSLQDVRNKRGADIASDHHLIIAKIQLKLLSTKKAKSRRKKFNVDLFKDPKVVQDYHILLQNKFSVLENLHDDETSINTAWEMTRDSIVQACEETVGYLQQNRKQWMSENTWKIVNERRQVKEKVLTAITRQQKKQTQEQYSNKDKEVKKSCKQDKRNFVEQLAKEAEAACSKGDTKTLYNITKQLSCKPPTSNTPIKDKDYNTLTKLEDQLERLKEHFEQVLNRPPPTDPPELQNGPILNIKTSKITKTELNKAIKSLKNGKAGGIDNIPPEAIKVLDDTSVLSLLQLLNKIWEEEEIPEGLLVKIPKKAYLQYLVNCILTYCTAVYTDIPKILFVATHKDKIPKNVETQREEVYSGIEELFKNHEGRKHLVLNQKIFVNATDESDPEIDVLKKTITDLTFQHPCWGRDFQMFLSHLSLR
ncbi:unnamed protein product [Mytilus edulis]|uniref:Uncharacterized protein n=1 Tax=Mytilus edulis TaxID=6550 RepID=A0A8S3QE68_MYTED|nr:unnamed protein product [Mytilus edulis]